MAGRRHCLEVYTVEAESVIFGARQSVAPSEMSNCQVVYTVLLADCYTGVCMQPARLVQIPADVHLSDLIKMEASSCAESKSFMQSSSAAPGTVWHQVSKFGIWCHAEGQRMENLGSVHNSRTIVPQGGSSPQKTTMHHSTTKGEMGGNRARLMSHVTINTPSDVTIKSKCLPNHGVGCLSEVNM